MTLSQTMSWIRPCLFLLAGTFAVAQTVQVPQPVRAHRRPHRAVVKSSVASPRSAAVTDDDHESTLHLIASLPKPAGYAADANVSTIPATYTAPAAVAYPTPNGEVVPGSPAAAYDSSYSGTAGMSYPAMTYPNGRTANVYQTEPPLTRPGMSVYAPSIPGGQAVATTGSRHAAYERGPSAGAATPYPTVPSAGTGGQAGMSVPAGTRGYPLPGSVAAPAAAR